MKQNTGLIALLFLVIGTLQCQDQYTVSYDANGGIGVMADQIKSVGVDLQLSSNTFTRTGYAFSGWDTQAGGGGASYADGTTYSADASVTLYAQWTVTYAVQFRSNGGSGVMATQYKLAGVDLVLPNATFTRTGYSFIAWNDVADGSGSSFAAGDTYTTDAAITLYAQWDFHYPPVITEGTLGPAGTGWIVHEENRNWFDVASSSDGMKLAAVAATNYTYTSADGGLTWTRGSLFGTWWSIASSADGTKLAAVWRNGYVYTSTDSGATWTARDAIRLWNSIASSSDGTKLVAVTDTQLYTSTDSGVTWAPQGVSRNWRCVASSSDGTKLVAGVNGGQLYTSVDSGVTWTPHDSNRTWWSVASSSDGTKLVAAERYGRIYTSSDSGATWMPRGSNRDWLSVSSSADGNILTGAAYNDFAYFSADSGITWLNRDAVRQWFSNASSSDGSRMVAVVNGGKIYTSVGPRSIAVTMSTNESPTPFALTLHATDRDLDTLTWSISSNASNGVAMVSGTGTSKTIGYNPTIDFSGDDSFVVQVSDGSQMDRITVNVNVTPLTYVISFDANGGSGVMSDLVKTHNIGIALTTNVFTRSGYTFSGWATAANGSGDTYAGGATYAANANMVLYAQWTPNTYNVSYDANGGTGSMADQVKTYAVDLLLTVNVFTRSGFTFTGWNTAPNGSGTAYADGATYSANEPATLYAVWQASGGNGSNGKGGGGRCGMGGGISALALLLMLCMRQLLVRWR